LNGPRIARYLCFRSCCWLASTSFLGLYPEVYPALLNSRSTVSCNGDVGGGGVAGAAGADHQAYPGCACGCSLDCLAVVAILNVDHTQAILGICGNPTLYPERYCEFLVGSNLSLSANDCLPVAAGIQPIAVLAALGANIFLTFHHRVFVAII
jgi:hypothetical protein